MFKCFRHLIRKYALNIDAVDPQMKNNRELAELLEVYENSWSLGRDQILDSCHRHQLIKFADYMQDLSKRFPTFKEQLEGCDAEIFLSIPSLIVLRAISNSKDSHYFSSLANRFSSDLNLDDLKTEFNLL